LSAAHFGKTYEIREASFECLEVEKERLIRLENMVKVFVLDGYEAGPGFSIIRQQDSRLDGLESEILELVEGTGARIFIAFAAFKPDCQSSQ